jgi:hypothetical protein
LATQSFFYSNNAVDNTLGNVGGISNSVTSMFLTTAPSGYPASFPFRLVLGGSEVVHVTAGAGTSGSPWTIVRGQDGTTASAWAQNSTVWHRITQGDVQLSRLHEGSVQADLPHGLPSAAWNLANFTSITTSTLGVAAATFTASSIPNTYKNLILVVNARLTENTVQADDVAMTLNGDTGAHYSYMTIFSTNITGSTTTGAITTPAASTAFAQANWPAVRANAASAGAAVNAGGGVVFIPNYAAATFNKMFWSISGAGNGTSAMVDGRWRLGWWNPVAQAAVSSLTLTAPGGGNFLAGSFFELYGLG